MNTKTAMITIAGRPNVGKSTLTNYLVGEKIAIVSNKPQTTRNRICGIVTRENTQFVFLPLPILLVLIMLPKYSFLYLDKRHILIPIFFVVVLLIPFLNNH